jgi:hypothetical protein
MKMVASISVRGSLTRETDAQHPRPSNIFILPPPNSKPQSESVPERRVLAKLKRKEKPVSKRMSKNAIREKGIDDEEK